MFKRIAFIMCVGIFFFVGSGLLYSQQGKEGSTAQATAQKVEVGNKICPVSGEKIEEATKVTYEYNGKIYNLCCAACIEAFSNNPEKYIQIVNEEMDKK